MKLLNKTKIVMIFMAVLLLLSVTNLPVSADSQKNEALNSLKSVYLDGESYIQLKNLYSMPGNQKQTIAFTLSLSNKGNSDIQFIDYWVNLRSKSGTSFSINMMDTAKGTQTVPSNSTSDFQFYASVDASLALSDLIFDIIKWDFNQPNFKRALGSINVPMNYSNLTPVNTVKELEIEQSKMSSKVEKLVFNKGGKENSLNIDYKVQNIGKRSINFPEYNFYVLTEDEVMYKLNTTDTANLVIQPQFIKTIKLKTNIPNSISANKLQLLLTKVVTGIELPIGLYQLPEKAADQEATAEKEKAIIDVDGDTINGFVKKIIVNRLLNNSQIKISFTMENESATSITVPNYEFIAVTSDGLQYPMSTSDLNNLKLNPKESKTIELSVLIPIDVSAEDLTLNMNTKINQDESFKVASFKTPSSLNTAGQDEFTFTDSHGTYKVSLGQLQRLPWEDEDIVSAMIKIENVSQETLPVPNLNAVLELDGIKIQESQLKGIVLDSIIGIKPKQSTNLVLLTKIPYTYDYSKVKLLLQEKDENETIEIGEVEKTIANFEIPSVDTNQTYGITGVGRRSELQVQSLKAYDDDEDKDNQLVYLEVSYKNLEKRATDLSQFVAYFKTDDGVYYPAVLSKPGNKLNPMQRALLSVSAEIPRHYSTTGLSLVIGEGIGSDGFVKIGETASAYIDAATMNLPLETDPKAKSSLEKLEIYPYTLTINKPVATVTSPGSFKLDFNYNLKEASNYSQVVTDHNLVFSISDGTNKLEKTVGLAKAIEGTTDKLELADGKDATLYFNIPTELQNKYEIRNYTIKIYDECQGYRKLLGEKSLLWIDNVQ
jgi:LEA14-like dessication related protein